MIIQLYLPNWNMSGSIQNIRNNYPMLIFLKRPKLSSLDKRDCSGQTKIYSHFIIRVNIKI